MITGAPSALSAAEIHAWIPASLTRESNEGVGVSTEEKEERLKGGRTLRDGTLKLPEDSLTVGDSC